MNAREVINNPRRYFARALQEVELRTGLVCSRPSDVWIKLTERCNCRCVMCDIWQQNRESAGELSTEDWKRVFAGLAGWLGRKQVWLTGGEPFLRQDCIDLITYGTARGLVFGVITNGTMLTEEGVSRLAVSGLREYHTSIDAMEPRIHDHLRGISGAHRRATRNLLALKARLKETGQQTKIVIKSIIMGYNAVEILPLVEWVERHSFDEIKFQPLESTLRAGENPRWYETSPYWPKPEEMDGLLRVIDGLIVKKRAGAPIYNSLAELENFKRYFADPVSAYEQAKSHTFSSEKKRDRCVNAVSWMEILSRGGLRMCRHMPPQGDIRDATARIFWRNRPKCWRGDRSRCFKVNPHGTEQ